MAKRSLKHAMCIYLAVVAAMTVVSMATIASAQEYPSGIVSYWKFDEGSGTIAYDSVGSNDGALSGASWILGQVGGALDFSGSDYIEVPNSEALNPEHLTLELWTYPTSTGYYRSMAEKQLPGFAYPWVQYALNFSGNTSKPNFNVKINDIGYNVTADEPIPLNAWTYLAGTYDGETLKLYVNGALVKTATSPIGPIDSSPDMFYMGKPPSNAYYYGKLDEVAIYNRALTPEEIQQHYQNGLQGLGYEVVTPPSRPEPTVNMSITEMEVDLEEGKFKIKGYLDVTDPDFVDIILDPQSRMLLELQTGGTEDDPGFGIVGEDQIQLTTDDCEELKFELEED